MTSKLSHAIGLMSGTSMDGVDLCYIRFDRSNRYTFEILKAETYSYNNNWKSKLINAYYADKKDRDMLDRKYGEYLGNLTKDFISRNAINNIDFVASHGHTIFHKPQEGYTLQIGNGQVMADIVKSTVVCDFRTQDVKMGGQGAPLVPIGDELLFSDYDYCLNLGGFANVSYNEKNKRIAFDICPVNIVLNHYVNSLDLDFDNKGIIASTGNIQIELLNKLNNLEFYRMPYPKSLGIEWVIEFIYPLLDSYNLEIKDVLRTFIEHIAVQVSEIIPNDSRILVTGGGAFNTFLIDRLTHYLDQEVIIPENKLVNYKEALIFAFLGLLKLEGKVNVLSSVTGAKKDHSSGEIYKPKKHNLFLSLKNTR